MTTFTATDWLEFARMAGFHPMVVGYIETYPNALTTMTTSPRSWELVSDLLKSEKINDLDMFRGVLGDGTIRFIAYIMVQQIDPTTDVDVISQALHTIMSS